MLISPQEPLALRQLGTVSPIPEKYGADVLLLSVHGEKVGIQRKEMGDLINSVHNGLLAKEVQKMKALDRGMLLVEGEVNWSQDGKYLGDSSWTLAQHQGLLWSMQSRGLWITYSHSLMETLRLTSLFARWITKERSQGLNTRPKVKGEWGKKSSREWSNHLLQGFEGIGYERAESIIDFFGEVPLAWTVGPEALAEVPGIGKGTAARLLAALGDDKGGKNGKS